VPIVFGIGVITFVLFFIVNKPEDMARRTLGPKATPEAVAALAQLIRAITKPNQLLFIDTPHFLTVLWRL
jgi:ABC-type dipeptide/oligopeptide/nickel transport system permease component